MVQSVDGLISGLSTSGLIDQLMTIESAGQTKLKNKVTTQRNVNAAFQALNTKVANLKSAAASLTDSATWKAAKATTSNDSAVTVTGSATAVPGDYTISVDALAQAHRRSAVVPASGAITDGTGVKITIGKEGAKQTFDITPTSQTAQGVVAGINASNSGVRASLIATENGSVLQLTATKTGAASQFEISGLNVTTAVDLPGSDAKLTVSGKYEVTSSSNTFTNAIPGVTLTAKQQATNIEVAVLTDAGGIADKVSSLVGLANSLITDIKGKASQPTESNSTAGPLAGNYLVRTLASEVTGTVSSGVNGYGSLASLGIETTKTGTITFDRSKFLAAYEADPGKVKAMIQGGLAPAMQGVADRGGTNLTAVIQNGESAIKTLNGQIENWDVRLKIRRESLQKQYSNLEVALGKLQEQSSWLSAQLSSLNSGR